MTLICTLRLALFAGCLAIAMVFPGLAAATSISISGSVGYSVYGSSATLTADKIQNNVSGGYSGSLKMQLWASSFQYDGSGGQGYVLAEANLGQLNGGAYFYSVSSGTVAWSPPPDGLWYVTLLIAEYTGSGWVAVAYNNFANRLSCQSGYCSTVQSTTPDTTTPSTTTPSTTNPTTTPTYPFALSPGSLSANAGSTYTLTAQWGSIYACTSSRADVYATVTGQGSAVDVYVGTGGAGQVTITCTSTAGTQASSTISIAPVILPPLTLTPSGQEVSAGGSFTLTPVNGYVTNCTSDHSGITLVLASGGAAITGSVKAGASAGIATITCTGTTGKQAVATVRIAASATAAESASAFTPTSDFTDNRDGTVTHKLTGLVWKRCAEGQTWTGSTCTGLAVNYTFNDAWSVPTSFAGKSDWRLPTPWELASITDYAIPFPGPTLNSVIFPATQSTGFWTGLPYAEPSVQASYAWGVNLANGYVGVGERQGTNLVRLVRGVPLISSFTTPTADFVDNGDGTLTHQKTGLIWKRCAEGQDWSQSSCLGNPNTYGYDQALGARSNYGGSDGWRLPNIQELLSIAEYGAPAQSGAVSSQALPFGINQTLFPNLPTQGLLLFWSATSVAADTQRAWYVDFYDGFAGLDDTYNNRANAYFVRLVRGGAGAATITPATGIDCFFNWAEKNYAQLFVPAGATTKESGIYTYRYYAGTGAYLAQSSSDQHIYYLGPASARSLLDVGSAASWKLKAGCP